jgi:hypothetical protein
VNRAARLLPDEGTAAVLELVRGGRRREPGRTLTASFNLTDQPQPSPVPAPGEQVLLCSEAPRYGGARQAGAPTALLPYECVVFGPAGWPRYA